MSDWGSIVEEYLKDFKERTTATLFKIAESFARSGKTFDDQKIEVYLTECVKNKLVETFRLFDIESAKCDIPCSNESNDIQFISQIKSEPIAIEVSTSNEADHLSLCVTDRPSFNFQIPLDQRSTCSPSTSNLPITSPNLLTPAEIKIEDDLIYPPTISPFDDCIFEESRPKRAKSTEINFASPKKQKKEEKTLRKMHFACMYCFQTKGSLLEHISSETFDEVYKHWESTHNSKPFQFFGVGLAVCYYCDEVDTYPQLLIHHKSHHRNEVFVLVDQEDRSKCALCHKILSRSEMVIHANHDHNPLSLHGIENPICLTQSEIDILLSKNSPPTVDKQVKSFTCGHCNVTKCSSETLCQHLKGDTFLYMCSICDYNTKDIAGLAHHEEFVHNTTDFEIKFLQNFKSRLIRHYYRTRITFANGLVLFKHNVLNTSYDDHIGFWLFKEQFAKCKIDEFNANVMSLTKERELTEQCKLRNNIVVTGLRDGLQRSELIKAFETICDMIGVYKKQKIIEDIFRGRDNVVIVKVTTMETKKIILNRWYNRSWPFGVKCNKLDFATDDPTKIQLRQDLTPFFERLFLMAESARKRLGIWSYWVSDQGLFVKRTRQHRQQLIWTEDDLMRVINHTF